MYFKKLTILILSSSFLLASCEDININVVQDDKSDNSNISKQQHQTQQQYNNRNQQQRNKTITLDKARAIASDELNANGSFYTTEDLIYRKDKSNANQVFFETPLFGINSSVKQHVMINRNNGKIIEKDGGPPSQDGPIRSENGKVEYQVYNQLVKYYNNYVYRSGDPVYHYADKPVTVEQYNKVSKLVWEYIDQQLHS